jgi:hypothetical protein
MHGALSAAITAPMSVHPLHAVSFEHASPASADPDVPVSAAPVLEASGVVVGVLASSCTPQALAHAEHPAISDVAQPAQSVVQAARVEVQPFATQFAQDAPTIPERSPCVHVAAGGLPESVVTEGEPSFPDPESSTPVLPGDASPPFPLPPLLPPLLDEHPKRTTDDPKNNMAFSTSTLPSLAYQGAHQNDDPSVCRGASWRLRVICPKREPTSPCAPSLRERPVTGAGHIASRRTPVERRSRLGTRSGKVGSRSDYA